jgi:Holliday junction resolvase
VSGRTYSHPLRSEIPWLGRATASIQEEYFRVAAAGRNVPKARERVYAYELYHQLRKFLGEAGKLRLMGEVDKRGTGTVSAKLAPDLILHVPGSMNENSLVIEIKSAGGRRVGFQKDLKTLTRFRKEFQYSRAILLVYGTRARRRQVRANAISTQNDNRAEIDLALIELWWHDSPGEPARFVSWELSPHALESEGAVDR